MSDSDSDSEVEIKEGDGNSCSKDELEKYFPKDFNVVKRQSISENSHCCIQIAADSNFRNIALAFSDFSLTVCARETLQATNTFNDHSDTISCVRFLPNNDQLLCSSSKDGTIKLWDLRAKNSCTREFSHSSDDGLRPLASFDASSNDKLICAGTELVGDDAYILFWDVRSSQLLGGYWECHSDDIVEAHFCPTQPDTLVTAGVDGLISVLDVSQKKEDDALTYCLNAESGVETVRWLPSPKNSSGKSNQLTAVTDMQMTQLWNVQDSAPTLQFSREKISKMGKLKYDEDSQIVELLSSESGDPLMLLSSAASHSEPVLMRTLTIDQDSKQLIPHALLHTNQESNTVRVAAFDAKRETFLTGNESGQLTVWQTATNSADNLKVSSKKNQNKKHKHAPY